MKQLLVITNLFLLISCSYSQDTIQHSNREIVIRDVVIIGEQVYPSSYSGYGAGKSVRQWSTIGPSSSWEKIGFNGKNISRILSKYDEPARLMGEYRKLNRRTYTLAGCSLGLGCLSGYLGLKYSDGGKNGLLAGAIISATGACTGVYFVNKLADKRDNKLQEAIDSYNLIVRKEDTVPKLLTE